MDGKLSVKALAQNAFVHVAVAFLAMGGWAVFANRAHPLPEPLVAGLVQGALSGAITLALKRMIEALAARLSGLAALLAPPAAAVLLSIAVLTTIHALAGTPEIATTIALPTSVTALYSALYAAALFRARKVSHD
ncbi:hypothetical protein ABUE31_10265 [Mesorhizobium sp. ZMM04-5]|uniref:Transmembrane protein n=1 Tax=Mesorhizobium marinum TaxID=3228790 RepID=A0ABV3QZ56_9HYPH